MWRSAFAVLISALVTHCVAVVFNTQLALAKLAKLGVPLPIGLRLETTAKDLLHTVPLFLIVSALALAWAVWLRRIVFISKHTVSHLGAAVYFALVNGGFVVLADQLMQQLIGIALFSGFRESGIWWLAFS